MISLTSAQKTILSSPTKRIRWTFDIVTNTDPTVTYHWSTCAFTYDGTAYEFKVLPKSFTGIRFNRSRSAQGLLAPADLAFTASNPDTAMNPADFPDGTVTVRLLVSDGTTEAVIRSHKFAIQLCRSRYQHLEFACTDILSNVLDGTYPNTPKISDLFPANDTVLDDDVCVPLPFGTAYVPLRSAYITDQRWYVLGPADQTYTISKVRSPRDWGAKSEWASSGYTFLQATKTDSAGRSWRVFQPIVAQSVAGGSADTCGLWQTGNQYLDMPTQFSRSDTAALTNPADAISFVLQDMGLSATDLDSASFAAAKAVFVSWGLVWNGALWEHGTRESVLARLLAMCHCVLDSGEQIQLRVLDNDTQVSITGAQVLRIESRLGEGSFSITAARRQLIDSAYVHWQQAGESQDAMLTTLVAVGAVAAHTDSDALECPWVADSQQVNRLAALAFQRRYLTAGSFSVSLKCGDVDVYPVALQPDDPVLISGDDYGGPLSGLLDSIQICRTGEIAITAQILSSDLDDWDSLTPVAIAIAEDDTDSDDVWTVPVIGPDSDADINSFGELALLDMISAAKCDETLIVGGYLKASLIQASNIYVGELDGAGSLATQSSISLSSSQITNKSLSNLDYTANLKLAGIATGADVTGSNTAADTSKVNGLASATLISGGKIGTGLVVANSVAAGIISAAHVGTNEIIANAANLKNAVVETLKINGNAVTIPISVYTAASITIGTTKTLIQRATITSTGSPIYINISFLLWGTAYYVWLYKGTTKLYYSDVLPGQEATYSPFAMSIVNTPGSGSVTYTLYVKTNNPTGAATHRNIMLLEVKR